MKNANLMLGEGMCPHCLGMIEVETDPDGNLTIAALKKGKQKTGKKKVVFHISIPKKRKNKSVKSKW